MDDIYLTVKEIADLMGCTERRVRQLIEQKSIDAETIKVDQQGPGRGGLQYRIPLSALDNKLQVKYKRIQKRKEKLNTLIESEAAAEPVRMETLTADERREIDMWNKLLTEWRQFRSVSGDKEAADASFIELMNVQKPEMILTRGILYRKWRSYQKNGDSALIDRRGKHGNHVRKLVDEVWDVFEYYYLDESQKSVSLCMTLTEMNIEKIGRGDLLPLPSSDTFERHAKKIPVAYVEYYRYGRKAFLDKCAPYIKRVYDDLEANEIWVADNHTFDIMVNGGEKPIRLYLTAFLDVRSRKMMGWYVTDTPSSDATLFALRKGIEKYGIPKMIYTDNGREFLTHDIGGTGFRKKKADDDEHKPPTILERLGIEFRTALPKNAKAKIIERTFRTVKETFSKLFDGYTGGNIMEKPERLKTVIKDLTNLALIDEFKKYVDTYITGWYNKQPHTGEGMYGHTPDEVYAATLIEKRIATEDDLNLMLMRNSRMLKVRRNGVTLKIYGGELQFWNDELLLKYFDRSVYVRYNPEDLSSVRIYDEEDKLIMIAPQATRLGNKASKEELQKEQKKNRSLEKAVKSYKKQKNIQAVDELSLMIEKALEQSDEPDEIAPKVLRPIRADEYPLQKAVGGTESVYEEPIDWQVGLERLKKAKQS